MHIAVVSGYDKRNYGSMLQAYATEVAIRELGHDVVTLDRSGLDSTISRNRLRFFAKNALNLDYYKTKGGLALHRVRQRVNPSFKQKMQLRYRMFKIFEESHFTMSCRTTTFDEFAEHCRSFDAVVLGSDQLWTPANIAGDYYTLNHVPDEVTKASYATSFGVAKLDQEYTRKAKLFLERFQSISVREESGAQLVSEIAGREAKVVCDPTLLLSADAWLSIASQTYSIPDEPYVFCYFLGRNGWQRRCAQAFAKQRNMKVLAISHCDEYIASDDHGFADLQPYDVGPAEWLSLLFHASYVCTDSFHGTLFSTLLHRPFVSFRRYGGSTIHSTNTRLDTLLSRHELTQRICQSEEAFGDVATTDINWPAVDALRSVFMEDSRKWLRQALGE